MLADKDPIVAIATPPGRGGIGIVRVSGEDLDPIAVGVLGTVAGARLRPRHAHYARFLDAGGDVLDSGIALFYPGPHSFTGQDVLEFQGHGGPAVQQLVLARCLEAGRERGARLAEPGEFTRRAYLNGRIDLAQAEAVADLIEAGSAAAARCAARSLQGQFSQEVRALGAAIDEARALAEALLDFSEEALDAGIEHALRSRVADLGSALATVRQRAQQGARLRHGLHVVIAGAPNVGKSSLLNALAGEEAAIVSERPGTTRDRVEREIEIEGLAVHLCDTAGLRETDDEIEQQGIARTLDAMGKADLVLEVRGGADAAQAGVASYLAGCPRLRVVNKIDLSGEAPGERADVMYVSARTGAGLEALRARLLAVSGWHGAAAADNAFLARERHLLALERARGHLEAALQHALAVDGAWELLAEELRLAAGALAEIVGMRDADDILGQIFGRFCIGK